MANLVILTGNLGNDPEFKDLEGGKSLSRFSLATTEIWRDKEGNKQEKTEWHNCVIWGNSAKTINQYCQKGSKLYVEGKITYRSYEKDGEKKYFTEIVVNNFEFIGGKKNSSNSAANEPVNQSNEDLNNELPF
jgi:single-strand DNA-binding protein